MKNIDFERFIKVNYLRKIDLANYLGVSPSFISKILKGKAQLPATQLKKILEHPDWNTTPLFAEVRYEADMSTAPPLPDGTTYKPTPEPKAEVEVSADMAHLATDAGHTLGRLLIYTRRAVSALTLQLIHYSLEHKAYQVATAVREVGRQAREGKLAPIGQKNHRLLDHLKGKFYIFAECCQLFILGGREHLPIVRGEALARRIIHPSALVIDTDTHGNSAVLMWGTDVEDGGNRDAIL